LKEKYLIVKGTPDQGIITHYKKEAREKHLDNSRVRNRRLCAFGLLSRSYIRIRGVQRKHANYENMQIIFDDFLEKWNYRAIPSIKMWEVIC
jgi:hypothetical protein